jgi:DeoR/GlpR family transcriptional regulator of sugar metabolism/ABC-type sugar transport system substrate-binding protein
MAVGERREQIVSFVEERGFISVKELSDLCGVSEMTIRRDLTWLDEHERVRRTYGGATSLQPAGTPAPGHHDRERPSLRPEGSLVDRVDVLIASSVDPKYDSILLDRVGKRNIPIIAESLSIGREEAVVSVDNHGAGTALGQWVGRYAQEHWGGQALALDLSYRLTNTQARSQGFLSGLREVLPQAQVVLSINAQSQFKTAYDLATDALTVHPNINVIFAINDTTAWGAIRACRDLGLAPESLLVVPFGLEGDTLRNALMSGEYCKVGLAMFPEIVGRVCVEAAIRAHNGQPLAEHLVTPYAVLTSDTLSEFYTPADATWHINWDTVRDRLFIPLDVGSTVREKRRAYPERIGFIVPFREHEWYRNLISCMRDYVAPLDIELEIVDADRNMRGEMDLRRREIARIAADMVRPGDVILIDAGQVTTYLAERLAQKKDITVITNSLPVFQILKDKSDIALISTGGQLRPSTTSLIGHTAELALRELRADKLFLAVTGITLGFGLSHTDMAEVSMKQTMLRAAREVILLADHAVFGQESVAQVAPTEAVDTVITDEALPASVRLELKKLGIHVVVARV